VTGEGAPRQCGADTQANPNTEIALVDKASAIVEDVIPGVRVAAMSSSDAGAHHRP
jgi:hypothetical protein